MKYLIFIVSIIELTGCSYAYKPKIQISHPPILMKSIYQDNTIKESVIRHNSPIYIGRGDNLKDNIVKLQFIKDGKLLYDLNSTDVKKMIKIENEVTFPSLWSVTQDGIFLRAEKHTKNKIILKNVVPEIRIK